MKKLNCIASLILAGALVIGSALTACSPHGSGGAFPTQTQAVTTTGTVTQATTNTAGQRTAKLDAATGSYEFTETSSASAFVVARPLASVSADTTKGGTWTFTETGKQDPTYSGTYKGDISQFGTAEVKLELTVEKAANNEGKLVKVEEASGNTFDFTADTSKFEAEIPAVTIDEDAKDEPTNESEKNDESEKDNPGVTPEKPEKENGDKEPAAAEGEITSLEELIDWLNENASEELTKGGSQIVFEAEKYVEKDTTYSVIFKYSAEETGAAQDGEAVSKFKATLKTDGTVNVTFEESVYETGKYALSTDGKYVAAFVTKEGEEGEKYDEPELFEISGTTLLDWSYIIESDDEDEIVALENWIKLLNEAINDALAKKDETLNISFKTGNYVEEEKEYGLVEKRYDPPTMSITLKSDGTIIAITEGETDVTAEYTGIYTLSEDGNYVAAVLKFKDEESGKTIYLQKLAMFDDNEESKTDTNRLYDLSDNFEDDEDDKEPEIFEDSGLSLDSDSDN